MKTIAPKVAVIIPSYNESKNLRILIPDILRVVPNAQIILVDDSSGREMVRTEEISRKYRTHVTYIPRRGKSGRGSAVIEGMKAALRTVSVQIIVEMDADLAHNPHEIPSLLSKIGTADMVIGSRYMYGSKIVKWPLSRLIQSKIINFVLKYWLGLHISDYTNGFRAYTRKACEYLSTIQLREKGFISLSEVAYKLQKKGFIISEVPITFTERRFGKSNAGFRELMSSLMGVIRIKVTAYSG
jgi:dolichol-phosphate mannosyltransferase